LLKLTFMMTKHNSWHS